VKAVKAALYPLGHPLDVGAQVSYTIIMSTPQDVVGVIVIGLGPIGRYVCGDICTRHGFELVGVVDINPELSNCSIEQWVPEASQELRVVSDLTSVSNLSKASVAIVCTSSKLEFIAPIVLDCLGQGLHVVSSCEELLYPWNRHFDLSTRIDEAAKGANRSVLGTGINPGFLMDYLPGVLTGLLKRLDKLEVERIQDATTRRLPFQLKIGAGLSVANFQERVAQQSIGHRGLTESIELIGEMLGIKLDKVTESIEPVISNRAFKVGTIAVMEGGVSGVEQVGIGYLADKQILTLRFIAALEHPDPCERIIIHGEPSFEMVISGGVHGDVSTSALLLNTIGPLMGSEPGLKTMATIAPATCR